MYSSINNYNQLIENIRPCNLLQLVLYSDKSKHFFMISLRIPEK